MATTPTPVSPPAVPAEVTIEMFKMYMRWLTVTSLVVVAVTAAAWVLIYMAIVARGEAAGKDAAEKKVIEFETRMETKRRELEDRLDIKRKELEDKIRDFEMKAVTLISDKPEFQVAIINRAFPPGPVLPFLKDCPAGWTMISDSAGRYLRGKSPNDPKATGGAATVALALENIPKMTLKTTREVGQRDPAAWVTSGPQGQNKTHSFSDRDGGYSGTGPIPFSQLYVGSDQVSPIPVEPLYLAVTFCQRL